MKEYLASLSFTIVLFTYSAIANNTNDQISIVSENSGDSLRIAELDEYWIELSRTVREGDYEGYAVAYHDDAIVVFATGKNKVSVPIATALNNWKQGFIDTKNGKKKDNVEFRFSQRIGDETTAHETGIFHFTSYNETGKETVNSFTHFEMLFIKKNGTWLSLMEYQRAGATEQEWAKLK